jgi:hypothetical protein
MVDDMGCAWSIYGSRRVTVRVWEYGLNFHERVSLVLFDGGYFSGFGTILDDFGRFREFSDPIFPFFAFFRFSVTVYSHGGREADD